MTTGDRTRKLIALVAGVAAGALIVFSQEQHSRSEALAHVEEIAPLVAHQLWNLDIETATDQAHVLLDSSDYQAVRVLHPDGRIFLEQTASPHNGVPGWLLEHGIIPLETLSVSLEHIPPGQNTPAIIGTLEVEQPNRDLGVYLQAAALVVLGALALNAVRDRRRRQAAATELRRIEEHAAHLETQARLQERERQLQDKRQLEALGQLAAGVAHDLNNILTVVIGSAEVIELTAPDPGSRKTAGSILDAAERAANLTRQLLAFGRRQVFELQPVQLNDAIEDFDAILRQAAGDRVTLRLDLAPDLGVVQADPGQVEQVLLNLVVNARDAMPEGGTIDIITRNLSAGQHIDGGAPLPEGRWACFAVRDTGVGMDAETRARIFTPFFTTKAPGKGTGLGLTTVYGIVQQLGGVITVDSAPGRGSCFTVGLPRTGEATGSTGHHRVVSMDDTIDLRGKRVLLVEDRDDVRDVMATALTQHGFDVTVASDGLMALSVVSNTDVDSATPAFDIVITDLAMPGLGGVELASRLRQDQPGLKVLFVSGDANAELGEGFSPDADTAMLQKPFGAKGLVERVRELLASRGRGSG